VDPDASAGAGVESEGERMSEEGDPYADLKKLVAIVPRPAEVKVSVSKKERKRRQQFVMVPWVWVERLTRARHASTHMVAYLVLHLHWKRGGQPFSLANSEGEPVGITRWQKWAGLRELEQLGLVRLVRRNRKSPEITVITQP
jgi:hypothetical protein